MHEHYGTVTDSNKLNINIYICNKVDIALPLMLNIV